MIWLRYESFRVNARQDVGSSRERVVEQEVILVFDPALQLNLRWGLARPHNTPRLNLSN